MEPPTDEDPLLIDGTLGEGGGQVLRSALALSLATGRPFRIQNIRGNRARPGLRPQHLASVKAARRVGDAQVEGARKGSSELTFRPRALRPGELHIDVGTAGSACLVVQTVLPPLLTAGGPSRLTVIGGTHNPMAPPFDFLERVLFPVLERMGPRVRARLERPGFAPAGGGRIVVEVEPAPRLAPLELVERGRPRARRARALLANLPLHVAERELRVVAKKLGWPAKERAVEVLEDVDGAGNVLLLEVDCEHDARELVASFGEVRTRAEQVASRACAAMQQWLQADVPVGEHLADQLLLPLALGDGGTFRTLPLSLHARTQVELIGRFLPARIESEDVGPQQVEVRVHPAAT